MAKQKKVIEKQIEKQSKPTRVQKPKADPKVKAKPKVIVGVKIKVAKVEKKNGRPSKYTREIADLICEEIATTSKSLRTICLDDKLPSVATILKWLREDKEGFVMQYARAKDQQADMLAEEILEISDHTEEDHVPFTGANVVQRDKLRIDARKWIASKLKPKAYGDKLDVTSLGEKIEHTPTIIEWGGKEIQV